MKITSKQKMILDSIDKYLEQKKENPTSYKLKKYLEDQGVDESMKSVMQVIEALEKKELIRRDDKKIYLVENDNYSNFDNIFSLPVYGLASCGDALAYAQENVDGYLQVSKSLFRKSEPAQLFAVKALGDSMDRDGVNNGDYVIFEKFSGQAELEGKIVVAVINGMATIKRFKKVGGGVIGLFPNSKNKNHQPIFIHESDSILIAGVFKKILPVSYVSL